MLRACVCRELWHDERGYQIEVRLALLIEWSMLFPAKAEWNFDVSMFVSRFLFFVKVFDMCRFIVCYVHVVAKIYLENIHQFVGRNLPEYAIVHSL